VDDTKPWVLVKESPEKLSAVIYNLLEVIRHIALMLLIFIPDTAGKILGVYDANFQVEAFVWGQRRQYGFLQAGHHLGELEVLFPKIEKI
jgi:methionyl-tRNA synthetase